MPVGEWKIVAQHIGTGRIALQRTEEFKHTGNNEGTMTDCVKVLDSDLNIIFSTNMSVDWEYHGWIKVAFSEDGSEVVVTGSDGDCVRHRLDLP